MMIVRKKILFPKKFEKKINKKKFNLKKINIAILFHEF